MMYPLGKWINDVFGLIEFSRLPMNDLVRAGIVFVAALLAWFVMPSVFRRSHISIQQGSATRLLNLSSGKEIPYKESIWASLESPIRLLFTVIAIYHLAALLAPNTASQYLGRVWQAAIIVSLVWFLFRWKKNSFLRHLDGLTLEEKKHYLTLDNIASIVLLVLGGIAFAETCGVSLQSVGGLGGVVTAYAAKNVLGNILSGFSLHFSKPFSIGDNISVKFGLFLSYCMFTSFIASHVLSHFLDLLK